MNPVTPAPTAHRFFSLSRVWALALNTLTELTRQKIFYFLLLFALLIIGNSAFAARFSFAEEFQMLKDVALGAMSIFSSLLAILATAMLLPRDIEDRTLYTILAKPVPRFEYLLGKLAGVLFLLLIAVGVMALLFLAVLYFREQTVLEITRRQLGSVPSDERDAAIQAITDSTFNWNLLPGIALIYCKAAIIAAVTLLISTFASSGIFTVITSVMVYFIGHLQATAREFWLQTSEGTWFTRPLLAAIALIFPDFQAFSLTDDIVVGTPVPLDLFLQTGALAVLYVMVYYLIAAFILSGKEL